MSFRHENERELEMGVFVTRHNTGKKEGIVSEAALERHGWAADPLAAIERYRESMGWPEDVAVAIKTDEESNIPTRGFRLQADIGVRTTRHQKALRLIGQYLIDLANGTEDSTGFYGKGIEMIEED